MVLQWNMLLDKVLMLISMPSRAFLLLSFLLIPLAELETVVFLLLTTTVSLALVKGSPISIMNIRGIRPVHGCSVVFTAAFTTLGTVSWAGYCWLALYTRPHLHHCLLPPVNVTPANCIYEWHKIFTSPLLLVVSCVAHLKIFSAADLCPAAGYMLAFFLSIGPLVLLKMFDCMYQQLDFKQSHTTLQVLTHIY